MIAGSVEPYGGLVSCSGNKLPKFGRRVARLAGASDLRKVGERGQRSETG